MKKLHLAIATEDVASTVEDYSKRLGFRPCLVIAGEYALWRNPCINLSVRRDSNCRPGHLRHLGWEDAGATEFSTSEDVNTLVWERFTAEQQAAEILSIWPDVDYVPEPI